MVEDKYEEYEPKQDQTIIENTNYVNIIVVSPASKNENQDQSAQGVPSAA